MLRVVPRPVSLILAFDLLVFASALALFVLLPGPLARRISSVYPVVLGLLCTGLSIKIYRSVGKEGQAHRIWALLTGGFVGWALGELLWLVYDLLGMEPYPSWADLFYLAGDLCLLAFFAMQVRFLRVVLRGWKRYLAVGLILLFLLVAAGAVYIPMLARPSRNWLEFGLNLAYETSYLFLLIGATVLALALYEGWLGRRWMVFVSGIWLYALANQVFFYATWHDLYYPGGQATPVSVLFDLLYIGSYLVMLTGLYLRQALPFPALRAEEVLASLPKRRPQEVWVLLSDESGRTSFVDPRLPPLLGIEDVGTLTGEFVGNILRLRRGLDDQILQEVRAQGYSRPQQVLLGRGIYALQAVAEKGTPTLYWLLTPWEGRLELQPGESLPLETLLAQAVRGTAQSPSSNEFLAWTYVQATASLLSLLCARFGGAEVAREFGQWFLPALGACEGEPGAECREHLHRALKYVLMVAPAGEVQQALSRLEAGLGKETVRAAENLGLRLQVS
ncbi:MAG: hypothetical protein RMK65_00305 [Anaerolineae bacterium]|nr:hypothetical protein [Anaerolineae bacterium]